ncbi:hypothetical protein H8356DRAFT_963152 [Neocallimastix lanati (nom. inval.)]|nr:hypothetical protein H8356DRAFT_963152 [Neocallimastix sp. JGI-2020a]
MNEKLDAYLDKQRKFVSLVKDVQINLNSKEYKKQGYTFNEYIKLKWNISQAQAYRYIMCAKVIDQLEEFEIKPSYESLCKSLNNVAKTPIHMKLLWSTIILKTNGIPDSVNSTHINQYWKDLCMDEKYSHICHYEDEESIRSKIEISLSKLSNIKKHKRSTQIEDESDEPQLNKKKSESNISKISFTQRLSKSDNNINESSKIGKTIIHSGHTLNTFNSSLSLVNNYNSSVSNNELLMNDTSLTPNHPYDISSSETLYDKPVRNELDDPFQPPENIITYYQEQQLQPFQPQSQQIQLVSLVSPQQFQQQSQSQSPLQSSLQLQSQPQSPLQSSLQLQSQPQSPLQSSLQLQSQPQSPLQSSLQLQSQSQSPLQSSLQLQSQSQSPLQSSLQLQSQSQSPLQSSLQLQSQSQSLFQLQSLSLSLIQSQQQNQQQNEQQNQQ